MQNKNEMVKFKKKTKTISKNQKLRGWSVTKCAYNCALDGFDDCV